MQFNRISDATALGAALAIMLGTAALADTIYVESPAVVNEQLVVPGSVLVPATTSTTVVEKRVVTQPAPTVVEERSVLVPQVSMPAVVEQQILIPAEPTTIMKRTVTVGTTTPTVTTQSTDISLETGPTPVFHKRIQLMREQIDLGLSKGLMSSERGSSFKQRLDSLTSEADSVVAEGTPKDLSDRLERRLNGINIEISNSMNTQLGSTTQTQ